MTVWRYRINEAIAVVLILVICALAGQAFICAVDPNYPINGHCVSLSPSSLVIGFLSFPTLALYPLFIIASLHPVGGEITLVLLLSLFVVGGWRAVRNLWPRRFRKRH